MPRARTLRVAVYRSQTQQYAKKRFHWNPAVQINKSKILAKNFEELGCTLFRRCLLLRMYNNSSPT
jgi:hypothetical protein